MRILYITSGFPFPLTSGYLRHYHFIRGLSQRHAVSLLSLVGRNFRSEHVAGLAPYTTGVLTFGNDEPDGARPSKAARVVRSLVSGTAADRPVERLGAAVRRSLREDPPDVILYSGKRTYPAIAGVRGVPILADMCDATSARILGRMAHGGPVPQPGQWVEYLKVRWVERHLLLQAAHLMFASCRDRERIAPSAARASVVSNGVDLDYWRRRDARLGTNTIVLTGAMDYAPNLDAALVLMSELLPQVRRTCPDVRLLIVGRDAPARLVEAGRRFGACVTGAVPDIRPYLEQASVFVAPLRFGAGIQNKLLEAMAMEVPVVTSPLGADGLRTEGGHAPPVAVARRPEEFVAQILRGLAEARHHAAPDHAARRFVEENFTWRASVARIEDLIAALAGRRAA